MKNKQAKFKKNGGLSFLTRRRYQKVLEGFSGLDKSTTIETLKEINKKDGYFINEFLGRRISVAEQIVALPEFILTDETLEGLSFRQRMVYIHHRVNVLTKEEITRLIKQLFEPRNIDEIKNSRTALDEDATIFIDIRKIEIGRAHV